jgi:hypothetical protein
VRIILGWFSILFLAAGTAPAQQNRYVGAGGCSGSSCHGSTRALAESESRIRGDEFSVWAALDRHANAYKVLSEPRSQRMAKTLGIADASTDMRCTSCHAVGSPEKSKSDGVACEACHGPAEGWLASHRMPNSHAASVKAGMIDTKRLTTRVETCLSCHLGSTERIVDHQLIAAGHPDLAFELDTFTYAQPLHHRPTKPSPGNTLPRMREWAVGQAMAFAEGMRLLAWRALRNWPEFNELECYQCHHDLRAESWRLQRGYPGRRPGAAQLNQARLDVLRVLAAQAAPDLRAAVESAVTQVTATVANRLGDGAAVSAAASAAARQGDALAARFLAQDFTPDMARAMVKALAADISRIAGNGVHSAEQAAMSLDALTSSWLGDKLQPAMAPLYDYLEHPSLYQPGEFAALFRKAASQAN